MKIFLFIRCRVGVNKYLMMGLNYCRIIHSFTVRESIGSAVLVSENKRTSIIFNYSIQICRLTSWVMVFVTSRSY